MKSDHENFKNLCYWILKTFILVQIINLIGLVYGVVTGIALSYLFEFVVCKIFDLEPFNVTDLCFVGWKEEYEFFITMTLVLEGKMKDKFKAKFLNEILGFFKKLRQKPIFLLGNYYWKTCSVEEAKGQIYDLDVKGLNTIDDIVAYVTTNLNQLFNLNEFQYRISLVENDNDETIVLIQCDHSLCDGMGFISLFCKLTDGFTVDKFPPLRKKTLLEKLIYFFQFPFYLPFCMIKVFLLRSGPTPFKFTKGPTFRKKMYKTKSFDFTAIYKFTKELGCTFNDYMLAVISKVAKKYCRKLGYNNDSINILCPVNLREHPKSEKDLKLSNESGAACIQIPLIDDINDKESLAIIKHTTSEYLRRHRFAETLNYTTTFVNRFLPVLISREIILSSSRHFDFVLSNVPGPKEHIMICGHKVTGQLMLMRPGTHSSFIAVMTYLNKVNVWMGHDEGIQCNGREFLNQLTDEIEASINSSKQN
jgi:hypothetical protein